MALTDENGGMNTTMLVSPAGNMGFNGGFGNGFGMGGDWAWILLLLLIGGNGFGWGMGGFGGMMGMGMADGMFLYPWMNQAEITTQGFQNQALGNQLTAIQGAINSGFGDTQLGIAGINQNICQTGNNIQNAANQGFASTNLGMCQGFNGVNTAISGAQNALAQQLYNNQISDLERSYNAQTASTAGMNNIAMNLQNCCCENRAATADLKYTVATEACADRAAVGDALQNVTMQNVQSTNALMTTIRDGIQSIKDDLCADRLDAERRENQNLRTQLSMAQLAASQNAQTATLTADNAAQTQYIVNRVAPYPTPSYIVGNPYQSVNTGCGCNSGCGCNGNFQ